VSLVEVPFDVVDATDGLVGELGERARREVKVVQRTSRAAVGEGDGDALALVCRKNNMSPQFESKL
jgi:hypothetical protein